MSWMESDLGPIHLSSDLNYSVVDQEKYEIARFESRAGALLFARGRRPIVLRVISMRNGKEVTDHEY